MSEKTNEMLIKQELERALMARGRGNEGMARVCARRAVGFAIGDFLEQAGYPAPGESAYDRLRFLSNLPSISDEVRQVAGHFLLRVTPEYMLPVDIDLIAEARWLIAELVGYPRT